ncbi:SDR family NAD(P)-dependent oxidoreductase [bacterium RCC_150]
MKDFSKRGAIISGAASGIGLEIAKHFAADGYDLALIDIDSQALTNAVESLNGSTAVYAIPADLGTVDGARDAVKQSMACLPYAHVMVCSAGILRPGRLQTLAIEAWDEMFAVHTRGPVVMAQEFIAQSAPVAGDVTRNHIIGISSIAASRPRIGNGGYSASKAALDTAFLALAAEVAPLGFNVNIVTPGRTNTAMVAAGISRGGDSGWQPSRLPPMGRIGEPDDVAKAVKFLCSDDAAFITGANIVVDGGSIAAV